MKLIKRSIVNCLFVLLACETSVQGYACGYTSKYDPNLFHPGCEQLKVTLHNLTNYTFVPDSTSDFVSASPGDTTFFLAGSANGYDDQDKVDVLAHYTAMFNGKKVGPEFTVHLQKNSCNAINTRGIKSDDHCYDHYKNTSPHCVESKCALCGIAAPHADQVCLSEYRWTNPDCANSVSQALVTSQVSGNPLPGIYISSISNFSAQFNCTRDTVSGFSDVVNNPGTTDIYINASPIEMLTITFPFNAQSPTAKLMKDSIYNNLNAKYLGQLGSYFSFSPVVSNVVDNKHQLSFSTLCNSIDCPKSY